MSFDSWTCLMVKNGPGMLPDDVCAELRLFACKMQQGHASEMYMRGKHCSGPLKTDWDSFSVGSRSGILFRAHFDWKVGECQVNFLLGEDDLRAGARLIEEAMEKGSDGAWEMIDGTIPVPELYKFLDLGKHRTLQ